MIPKAKIDEIKDLFHKGMSYKNIAEELGYKRAYIATIIYELQQKGELPKKINAVTFTDEEKKQILKMYHENVAIKDIAKALNTRDSKIYQYINRAIHKKETVRRERLMCKVTPSVKNCQNCKFADCIKDINTPMSDEEREIMRDAHKREIKVLINDEYVNQRRYLNGRDY